MLLLVSCIASIITLIFTFLLRFTTEKYHLYILLLLFSITYAVINILSRCGYLRFSYYAFIYLTLVLGLAGLTYLGWQSGIFLYLFLLPPIFFFYTRFSKLEIIIFASLYTIILVIAALMGLTATPLIILSDKQLQILGIINTLIIGLALGMISYLDYWSSNQIAGHLIAANEKLVFQATRDPLTVLYNRRQMIDFIEMEHVRSKRSDKPFSLIMIDIDGFKDVNDKYSHAAGDFVLVQLSHVFVNTLRKQDIVSRWGGEEFLVLLPETDLAGAQIAAEKLREIVAHTLFTYQGDSISVTVSLGSVICEPNESWDDAIKRADSALYYAKNRGKNVTIIHKEGDFHMLGDSSQVV